MYCRSVNVLLTNPIWVLVTRMQVEFFYLSIRNIVHAEEKLARINFNFL